MDERTSRVNQLGNYLRDRRAKLDPTAFGLARKRRRTPGLRREEVAQRAHISPTWYTWLEQGRGGAPSADVLDRIARALMLTDTEREHLFLLGLCRPPEVRYQKRQGGNHGPDHQRQPHRQLCLGAKWTLRLLYPERQARGHLSGQSLRDLPIQKHERSFLYRF